MPIINLGLMSISGGGGGSGAIALIGDVVGSGTIPGVVPTTVSQIGGRSAAELAFIIPLEKEIATGAIDYTANIWNLNPTVSGEIFTLTVANPSITAKFIIKNISNFPCEVVPTGGTIDGNSQLNLNPQDSYDIFNVTSNWFIS